MRERNRYVTAGIVLALALIAAAGALQPVARAQQPPKQVGLVIDFGDDYETYCVEFTESDLTGYDVLLKLELKSDLTIVADTSNPMGVTICDINETSGCPASNCFCQCQGSPCVYWSYHYLENGSWRYSQEGASNRQVHDGDVEGWGWGEGAINTSGHKPPVIPFDEICDPPATDPTETPIPPTETPTPTDTPAPTTPPEPEVWFRLDENPIAADSCTILRWDTAHVTEVYLDDESVSRNGSREVCPTTTQEYTLRVVSAADEQKHRLTLGVTGDADPTPTPTSPPASAPAQSSPTPPPPTATIAPTEPQQTAPASTPSPSPTPPVASATPTASPSPTPLQVAALDAALSATPEAGPATPTTSVAEASTPEKAPSESEQQNLPIGYVAFSLIAGGLLGWLVYIFKFQK